MSLVLLLAFLGGGVGFVAARRHRRTETSSGNEGGTGRMGSVARLVWAKAGSRKGSLLLLGLALLAGAGLLASAARYLSDDLRCPVDGEESNYGDAEWSWFPIGTTCRWTEAQNGFDGVEGPGWLPTLLIASMVGVGLGLVSASATAAGRKDAGPSVVP